MIYNQELNDWFDNYFNNCYYVKHIDYPESIFMFYDINYARQKKLAKLEDIDYVEKIDITGVCLFQLDWKYYRFNMNYYEIWCSYYKYRVINIDCCSYVKERLNEYSKLYDYELKLLLPCQMRFSVRKDLENYSKLNIFNGYNMKK